jgi:hypothetical protein
MSLAAFAGMAASMSAASAIANRFIVSFPLVALLEQYQQHEDERDDGGGGDGLAHGNGGGEQLASSRGRIVSASRVRREFPRSPAVS